MRPYLSLKDWAHIQIAIAEVRRLRGAFAEGRLTERGDVSARSGAVRELLNEINAMLDAATAPVSAFRDAVAMMSAEHERGDIDVVLPVAQFFGDLRGAAQDVNDMVASHIAAKKKAMACIAAFADGDFEAPLDAFPGKKAFLNDTTERLRGNLKGLIAEMNRMSAEHDKGDIDVFVPVDAICGDFATMAAGINTMVAGHIAVKKQAMASIEQSARAISTHRSTPFPARRRSSTTRSNCCAPICARSSPRSSG